RVHARRLRDQALMRRFDSSAGSPAGAPRRMSWSSALAIRAKRKGGQVIENKQSREMTDFAPLMISMAYDPVAKSLVSLGEMPPALSLAFPRRRGPRRNDAKSTSPSGLRGQRKGTSRKWRRNRLK